MNQKEIRARALEIAVQMIAALPEDWNRDHFGGKNRSAEEEIIKLSKAFEDHIRG